MRYFLKYSLFVKFQTHFITSCLNFNLFLDYNKLNWEFMLNRYEIEGRELDSVELKALVVSRGLKIAKLVYQKLGKDYRIYPNVKTTLGMTFMGNVVMQGCNWVAFQCLYGKGYMELG